MPAWGDVKPVSGQCVKPRSSRARVDPRCSRRSRGVRWPPRHAGCRVRPAGRRAPARARRPRASVSSTTRALAHESGQRMPRRSSTRRGAVASGCTASGCDITRAPPPPRRSPGRLSDSRPARESGGRVVIQEIGTSWRAAGTGGRVAGATDRVGFVEDRSRLPVQQRQIVREDEEPTRDADRQRPAACRCRGAGRCSCVAASRSRGR